MTSGDSRAINVGWLDGTHAFPQAPPTTELLTALFDKCGEPANKTRGWHRCELCDAPAPFLVERNGQNLLLGGAEIRVETPAGPVFAAPDLIYHYVRDHHYNPPVEFVMGLISDE